MSALDQSADLFLKPVEGQDDLFAFQYSFGVAPEGKAAPTNFAIDQDSVTELDDGDLLIEGWAANFEGIDRQGENFIEGAFQRGIKAFLDGQSALCFHHKNDHGIGKVLDLKEVPGKGLYMKARVDKQEPTSPLHYVYNGVKKGSYKGLSVGGFFKRKLTPQGWRIADMDFTEVSITPVAVHPGTTFSVVAGKALENAPVEEHVEDATEPGADALLGISERLTALTEVFEGKALPKKHDPSAASWLSDLLVATSRLRSAASTIKDVSDHDKLKALADEVETFTSTTEAAAHKLAAEIGPLPPREAY